MQWPPVTHWPGAALLNERLQIGSNQGASTYTSSDILTCTNLRRDEEGNRFGAQRLSTVICLSKCCTSSTLLSPIAALRNKDDDHPRLFNEPKVAKALALSRRENTRTHTHTIITMRINYLGCVPATPLGCSPLVRVWEGLLFIIGWRFIY